MFVWCLAVLCVCLSCDSGGDCECLCTAIAAYAEECSRRGVYIRWRSQELCRTSKSNDTRSHPCTHSLSPLCRLIYPYLTVFPFPLQLCSVRMAWCMIPVGRLALLRVPVSSKVHTPSAVLSPVWRAASAPLARSYMVGHFLQSNWAELIYFYLFMGVF